MNKYLIFFLIVFLISCNLNNNNKKKLIYQDSSNKYYVSLSESENNASIDTLYTFYNFNNSSEVKEVGFYKDGFHNDLWSYNLDTGAITIKWGYYKDKYLGFETNVFAQVDSIKYGDSFTKFSFTNPLGKLGLTVTINGAFKDSLPEQNYNRITKNELSKMGIKILYFKSKRILYSPKEIYINEIGAKMPNNEIKYLKGAFSFIDKNNFIEFSVSSSSQKNAYADILFNGVLTNFMLNGKRLYNPFNRAHAIRRMVK